MEPKETGVEPYLSEAFELLGKLRRYCLIKYSSRIIKFSFCYNHQEWCVSALLFLVVAELKLRMCFSIYQFFCAFNNFFIQVHWICAYGSWYESHRSLYSTHTVSQTPRCISPANNASFLRSHSSVSISTCIAIYPMFWILIGSCVKILGICCGS